MSHYEYRVVPAPASVPRIKGARTPEDRFAQSMAQILNAEGLAGWEFQRSESLTAEVRRGWLGKRSPETLAVLIFRRWIDTGTGDAWDDSAAAPDETAPLRPEPGVAQPRPSASEAARGDPVDAPGQTGPRLSARREGDGRLRPLPGTSRD